MLPDIVERVAALGPDVVPLLVDMLDPDAFGWGIIRATRAIERLASLHRGSCDAAAPRLVAVVHDKQGELFAGRGIGSVGGHRSSRCGADGRAHAGR